VVDPGLEFEEHVTARERCRGQNEGIARRLTDRDRVALPQQALLDDLAVLDDPDPKDLPVVLLCHRRVLHPQGRRKRIQENLNARLDSAQARGFPENRQNGSRSTL
jgi:hypothetical protein